MQRRGTQRTISSSAGGPIMSFTIRRYKRGGTITTRLLPVLSFLLAVIDGAQAIQCYKCAVTVEKNYVRNATIITPMCSKFDETDEYTVDCPYSTMCLKTISTLHLQNGQQQQTITRGCAQQKDTTQVFRNRKWQQEHSVQEVYEEGCMRFDENNLAGAVKTHCYCRGDLCNAGTRCKPPLAVMAVIFIVVQWCSWHSGR